jgi:hypothetical protein
MLGEAGAAEPSLMDGFLPFSLPTRPVTVICKANDTGTSIRNGDNAQRIG